jgi:CRP-like cAMP-binding protein
VSVQGGVHAQVRRSWDLPGPRQNQLLGALPERDLAALSVYLEPVSLGVREQLYGPDDPAAHAWFPGTAVISLQQVLDGRPGSEVALVGREGMVGLAGVLGDTPTTRRACVHCAGHAWRLPADRLRSHFDASPALRALLLRHAQGLMAQIAQNGVCYRLHSVEQQVCRRLLMSMDRLGSREIPVTHEALASALGVRREAVTLAACRLLADGLVQGGRGRIVVLDRAGLELRACECYHTLRAETERLAQGSLEPAR